MYCWMRDAAIQVKPGDRVREAAPVLAVLPIVGAKVPAVEAGFGAGGRYRDGEEIARIVARRTVRAELRKGMYILPSLFTTANIAAGFYAILQTVHGSRK